jgi:hypothetical protein
MRRVDIGAVLALLLVPALLVGCSSSPSDTGATPGAGTSGGSSSGSTGASGTTGSAVSPGELGKCMRDRGYDVEDSEFETGGDAGARFSAPEGVDAEQYSADLVECSGGAADGQAAKPLPGSDERNRKAAACIRAGGFPDYPDGIEEERKWTPPDEDTFDRVAKKCDAEAFGTGERFETGAEAGR